MFQLSDSQAAAGDGLLQLLVAELPTAKLRLLQNLQQRAVESIT